MNITKRESKRDRNCVLKSLIELRDCFGVLKNCKMMSSVTSSEFMML